MPAPAETSSTGGTTRARDVVVETQPWGRLEWMVSGAIGTSATLTVGKCFLGPGASNPVHHHPNCDEVLHVLRGRIRHRVGDAYTELVAGDTISIPRGAIHNAQNVGDEECELLICFDTAQRQVIGE